MVFSRSLSGPSAHLIFFTGGKVRGPLAVVVFALAFAGAAARGQSVAEQTPQKGGSEIQVWTGAGHSAFNGAGATAVWNAGLRYGWILTNARGPGVLRGRFEYAVDAVPLNLIFQPKGVVYGMGLNPLGLKWNFDSSGRVAPYFDFGGGLLFTSSDVPLGVSRVNFTSGPGIGANVGHGKAHWSVEVRWLHISDAGLTADNPGINVIQVRAGIGWFHHKE
jgi:lipid A 3-O-deacylase PagL